MSVGRQHPLWNLWHLLTLWCLELVMIFVFWSTAVIKASDAVANLRPRSSSCVSKMGAVWAVSNCDTIAVIHKPPRSSKSSPDPRFSQLFISQKCVRTYWDHHPKAALTVLENERKWDHQHPSIISQCQLVSVGVKSQLARRTRGGSAQSYARCLLTWFIWGWVKTLVPSEPQNSW